MPRVYRLKHATGRMKYQHMKDVQAWRAELKDVIANPPDRHTALEIIKDRMGAEFHDWYTTVYRLRSAGRQEEYEAAIFGKCAELTTPEHVRVATWFDKHFEDIPPMEF